MPWVTFSPTLQLVVSSPAPTTRILFHSIVSILMFCLSICHLIGHAYTYVDVQSKDLQGFPQVEDLYVETSFWASFPVITGYLMLGSCVFRDVHRR